MQKFSLSICHSSSSVSFSLHKKRLKINGFIITEKCIFTDNVVSSFRKRMITENGIVLKNKNTLFLPYIHKENTYFAYSDKEDERYWQVSKNAKYANIEEITPSGVVHREKLKITDGKLRLKINPYEAFLVELSD